MIGSIVGNFLTMATAVFLAIAIPIGGSIMDLALIPLGAVMSPFLFFGS
ncbi:hypothetical protein ACQPW1_17360 [Nocardia sp. CA-128927]